ncbi:MAG: DUF6090 family protein [Maribacter arcticus]|jgi:hypothetical protein|uniref:DUF6090 family protein n=1 Tax=Maribacter arcticus TaxID=561365 RepID=UPI003001CC86
MIKFFRKIRYDLMKKNKLLSYSAYAIGEVLLVVIGIYIAIQFNNWNEEKKQQAIVKTNIGILIETLKEDTIYYREKVSSIDWLNGVLDGYEKRLNQPTSNLDTLIKISRDEFRPGIISTGKDNNDAYNSMTMSGEINLFDKELRQDIYRLYTQHKVLEESASDHFNTYLVNLNNFNSKFGLNATSPFKKGPIAKAIWEDVDIRELAVAFHPMFNTKKNHLGQTKRQIVKVIEMTDALLIKLNQVHND